MAGYESVSCIARVQYDSLTLRHLHSSVQNQDLCGSSSPFKANGHNGLSCLGAPSLRTSTITKMHSEQRGNWEAWFLEQLHALCIIMKTTRHWYSKPEATTWLNRLAAESSTQYQAPEKNDSDVDKWPSFQPLRSRTQKDLRLIRPGLHDNTC